MAWQALALGGALALSAYLIANLTGNLERQGIASGLGFLDTTAGLILEVDEARVLRIPGESFWFPYTDFLFQIDGLGDLVDALAKRAAFDPFIQAERTNQWLIIGVSPVSSARSA